MTKKEVLEKNKDEVIKLYIADNLSVEEIRAYYENRFDEIMILKTLLNNNVKLRGVSPLEKEYSNVAADYSTILGKKRELTEQYKKLLFDAHLSTEQIAKRLNKSEILIRRALNKAGVSFSEMDTKNVGNLPYDNGRKIKESDKNEMIRLSKEENLSYREIGEIFKVSAACISKRFKRWGIPPKTYWVRNVGEGKSKEKYNPLFNGRLKDYIFERDNYKCQNPKCETDPNHPRGKRLAVHHIDYDKKNVEPRNLISICATCNAKANKDREHWKTFYQNLQLERAKENLAILRPTIPWYPCEDPIAKSD